MNNQELFNIINSACIEKTTRRIFFKIEIFIYKLIKPSGLKNNNFIPSFMDPIKEICLTNDDELTVDNNYYIQEYKTTNLENLAEAKQNKAKATRKTTIH